ncbi:MAG: hypothetical protein AAF316_11565, partial [Cyanobacteria bacterium P01_A01_bin.80]
KLIVSLRATAKQSQSVAMSHTLRVNASFHSVPLAMTNAQLILPKYLEKDVAVLRLYIYLLFKNKLKLINPLHPFPFFS